MRGDFKIKFMLLEVLGEKYVEVVGLRVEWW